MELQCHCVCCVKGALVVRWGSNCCVAGSVPEPVVLLRKRQWRWVQQLLCRWIGACTCCFVAEASVTRWGSGWGLRTSRWATPLSSATLLASTRTSSHPTPLRRTHLRTHWAGKIESFHYLNTMPAAKFCIKSYPLQQISFISHCEALLTGWCDGAYGRAAVRRVLSASGAQPSVVATPGKPPAPAPTLQLPSSAIPPTLCTKEDSSSVRKHNKGRKNF